MEALAAVPSPHLEGRKYNRPDCGGPSESPIDDGQDSSPLLDDEQVTQTEPCAQVKREDGERSPNALLDSTCMGRALWRGFDGID